MIDRICKKIEQNKYSKLLKILIGCGGFLFACVFISIKAHAEETGTIPYNVSQMASYNEMLLSDMDIAIDLFLSHNNLSSDTPIIVFTNDGVINGAYYEYILFSNPYCEQIVADDLDYTTNTITFKGDKSWRILVDISNGSIGATTSVGLTFNLLGNSTSVTTNYGSYLPRYPFYYNGEPIESGNDKVVLIANAIGPVPIEGHATAPTFGGGSGVNGSDFLGNGADFGASLSQATMPQAPTYNTFNFGTFNPPSFDDSSILDALDSIAQILIYTGNYIVSNILGAFSTLMGNIVKIGEYIVGVLEYIGRSIITNIQNAVQNLYENFVSLLQPLFDLVSVIREKFEYITEPFDKDEFFHQVDGNHLITACVHIEDYGQQMKSILTNAQERNTFHLNITYPKPDGTSFQTMISFDWLYPLRHLYMPYLWVFTILYLFFSACRLLGYVIGGKS